MYRVVASTIVAARRRAWETATTKTRQTQGRSLATTSNRAPPVALRRKRTGYATIPETVPRGGVHLGLSEAYRPHEANLDDYLAKTSLSPWVPLPDAACRALLDLVKMEATDRHVDLGSGDGRVNFWVADDAHVEWTLGVDVDQGILDVALERLAKRHPRPQNIDFVQADLLKEQDHPVWDRIRQATVISMYFATPALRVFRPLLEEQLRGHSCKIVTAGYPMPGWHAWQTTVVLGTTLHYYRWGEEWEEEMDDEDVDVFLADDFVLPEQTRNALEEDRFRGSKVIDRTTGRNVLQQQMQRFQDDEADLFADDEKEDEEEEEGEDKKETSNKKKVPVTRVKSCGRSQ